MNIGVCPLVIIPLTTVFSLLSQVTTPITPEISTGWWTVLLQGGSFSLLVYIVVKLGPDMMKESKNEREALLAIIQAATNNKDTAVERVTKTNQETLKDLSDDFEKGLIRVIDHCAQENKLVLETIRNEMQISYRDHESLMNKTQEVLVAIRDLHQSFAFREPYGHPERKRLEQKAVNEMKEGLG